MKSVNPTSDSIKTVLENTPKSTPIVMLNLLKFRQQADYGDSSSGRTGQQAYAEYSKGAIKCVKSAGGELVWAGAPTATLIGPETEHWDHVLLVRYPSIEAFFAMVESDEYQAIVHHRTAAVDDSRLVPMVEG
ncbi:DUF1330 domain-containing protein [Marinobacter koreensis]|uniref:DUF1330 domain-containing protein n=1 Tax=Marinobacter koreensis TaxID=335974 RepID=A0ABW0RL83_9GAMM|nr:DUF1330 domain-containing protein [Marinobacter koreensis]MCK7548337.1 DUF1330 domain-containing protein [Marinobacter koreensis]